jgi:(1->4)-alpha-D-glucan 1-alpha-D-glucosylmutase
VDFAHRRRELELLISRIDASQNLGKLARELLNQRENGRVKMFVTRQGLAFRRAHAALYRSGDYRPLEAAGPLAEHLCAFARVSSEAAAITVVPRLLARRSGEITPLGVDYWVDTALVVPDDLGARFRNVFTGAEVHRHPDGRLAIGEVFADFPVALLERVA